jgi:tetratricopeptide (TPR) repeat protein
MSLKSPLGAESFGEEVLFSWDEVPGAAAYTLMVGPVERAPDGSIMTSYFRELRSGIRLNTLRMGVAEEVQRTLFGRFIAYEGGRVKPESILGEFFLGGEFAWGVRAFDSEGRQIADSFGYNLLSEARQLPLFRIEPQPMSRADELLLSGRFDEAIERYMQGAQLRDAHCLLVLARLFEFGVEPGLAQPERAAAYYEQLLELGDDPRVRAALADIYFSLGRFADANAMYEALVGTPVENWHAHYQLARLKLIDGEPLSALRLFDKALSVEHVQYAYTVPIALALLAEDMQSACLMAERVAAARNHVLLIHEYLDLNIRMHPEAKAAFWRGEYGASLEMLGDGDHDQFFRALVLLATENPTASQEIQVILRNLKQEVLSALLAVLSS